MTILIISDLHIANDDLALLKTFETFCKKIKAKELYILGDLFDCIFLQFNTPTERRIQQILRELHTRGIQLYFMPGNRDFYVPKYFILQTGIKLLNDWHLLRLESGEKVLLTHGDLLCVDDISYQRYRRIVQSKIVMGLIKILPLFLIKIIAFFLNKKTTEHVGHKAEYIMDVCPKEVERIMQKWQVSTLIHGHTHKPKVHQLGNNRKRISNGMWHANEIWWIEISKEDISLHNERSHDSHDGTISSC